MLRHGVVLTLALGLPTSALAQDFEDGGLDAHGFVLTAQDGDLRDGFLLHRPGAMDRGNWFAGGVLEIANRTLVLIDETDPDQISRDPALSNLVGLNLTGGATVHERVRLTASMPVFFTSSSFGDVQGAGLGDLRLDAMLQLVRPEEDLGLGLGLVPWLDLPTGTTRKFLGRPGVAGGGAIAGSYAFKRATLLANLGLQFEPTVEDLVNLSGSDALVAGIGGNVLVSESTSIGVELDILSPFQQNARAGTGAPAETTFGVRHRLASGGFVNGGLALPVSRGAGAAQYRLFVGGGFGKTGPGAPKDTDLDGITDDLDACPDQPEVVNGVRDEDGCPDDLSTLLVDVTFKGESVSGATLSIEANDGGTEDVETGDTPVSRQVIPESTWKLVAKKGDCLVGEATALAAQGETRASVPLQLVPSASLRIKVVDTSGNPVSGAQMAWESDAADCLPTAVPTLDGAGLGRTDVGPGNHKLIVSAPNYRIAERTVQVKEGDDTEVIFELAPTKLKLEKNRIVILEKVQFATNKATILPESFELLDEVSDIIRRNPDAGRVEIQGHTDSRGSDTYNLDLSARRAESVMKYLVKHDVDKDRLVATGFGETQPIADNATPDGRAQNRRVEFKLIDQDSQSIEEPAP